MDGLIGSSIAIPFQVLDGILLLYHFDELFI
jgi:hypothetical protein